MSESYANLDTRSLRIAFAAVSWELGHRLKSIFSEFGIRYAQAYYADERSFVLRLLEAKAVDAIFIEVNDPGDTLNLVRQIRTIDVNFPICFVGSNTTLDLFVEISPELRSESRHFYRLEVNQTDREIKTELKSLTHRFTVEKLAAELKRRENRASIETSSIVSDGILPISILAGAIGLSIADSLPGGLTGGQAFLIITAFFFSVFHLAKFVARIALNARTDGLASEVAVTEEGQSYKIEQFLMNNIALVRKTVKEENK